MTSINLFILFFFLKKKSINPEKCRFSILSVKIEVTLAKANGISWASFEATDAKITQWTTFGVSVISFFFSFFLFFFLFFFFLFFFFPSL